MAPRLSILAALFVLRCGSAALLEAEDSDLAPWHDDESCGDEGECALSLRQLRGLAQRSEAVEALEVKKEKKARAKRRAFPTTEVSSIMGVPLYLHPQTDRDLGASPEGPGSEGEEEQRWIVNLARGHSHHKPWKLVEGSKEELKQVLAEHRGAVSFVEQDAILSTVPIMRESGVKEDPKAGENQEEELDNPPASWGLDRIDAKEGLDHWYESAGYSGNGSHVYMLDTGIATAHLDFGGRALPTLEVDNDGVHVCSPGNTSCAVDRVGHGTHTAGTVGGHRYGVAKAATLHACKTLGDDGSGKITWMIQALDWIVAHGERPAVASASLGGRYESKSLARAVDRTVDKGITVVVAAGNENEDACHFMPSRVASAITVGAIAMGDGRAPYSNWGACVDIFAPGSEITSAAIDSNTSMKRMSGTSMACPHVAGAAAILLAEDPTRSPADVTRLLLDRASAGRVRNPMNSSNLLLYTEPAVPRPVSPAGKPHFEVYGGTCEVDAEGCLSSPGYPAPYKNDGHCAILVRGGDVGPLHVEAFDTEQGFDTLSVNFQDFSGVLNSSAGALECTRPQGSIVWSSDETKTHGGWRICPAKRPPPSASGLYVTCGMCTVDSAGCASSPNYPEEYLQASECRIEVLGDIPSVEVVDFDTEAAYDALLIGNSSFSGPNVTGAIALSPGVPIVWSADQSIQAGGWKICPGTEIPADEADYPQDS